MLYLLFRIANPINTFFCLSKDTSEHRKQTVEIGSPLYKEPALSDFVYQNDSKKLVIHLQCTISFCEFSKYINKFTFVQFLICQSYNAINIQTDSQYSLIRITYAARYSDKCMICITTFCCRSFPLIIRLFPEKCLYCMVLVFSDKSFDSSD